MWALSLACGSVVGLTLGLTGGGGAILAVPMLVYVLDLPPREAVTVSLAVVGATSLLGFLVRWRQALVEIRVGALFATTGVLGAPVGTWIAQRLPAAWLLIGFAALMFVIAVRMWRRADRDGPAERSLDLTTAESGCPRDASGHYVLTQRCIGRLLILGAFTGILTGLFGVGGGFVIVPALVLFTRMDLPRAVGTSLFVIALVSASGLVTRWWSEQPPPWNIAAVFLVGSVGGLLAGQSAARRLSGPALQRTFAAAIVVVAAFVVWKNLA